jgi:hypothetical protein
VLRSACLLYGEEGDVWAARDPVRPPSGWVLTDRTSALPPPAVPPAGARPRHEFHGEGAATAALLRVFDAPSGSAGGPARALATLDWQGQHVFAFELTAPPDSVSATVARIGDVLVAWAVSTEEGSIDARAFGSASGQALGPAWHVAVQAYDPAESSGGLLAPVWAGRLGLAVLETVGARSAAFFATPAGPGRRVPIDGRADGEVWRTGVPLLVVQGGRLRRVPPR